MSSPGTISETQPSWPEDLPSVSAILDGLADSGLAALDGLEHTSGLVASMASSTQSPLHHAEGDVWTHTKMVVCEALALCEQLGGPGSEEGRILLATALLHDIAKPMTRTIKEDGDIGNPYHSPKGAAMARRILWRQNADIAFREVVCAIIAFHQVPFWISKKSQAGIERSLARMSLLAPNRLLHLQAVADSRGRRCADAAQHEQGILNVSVFAELAQEAGCWDAPYPFPNAHTRLAFLNNRKSTISLNAHLYDTTDETFEVTMLCGLPGTGKSSWVAANAAGRPVVSMDDLRVELGVKATQDQGEVRQRAKAMMKELLASRTSFIVDQTNLNPQRRGQIADLAMAYGARVNMVGIECAEATLRGRNRNRAQVVPDGVISRMIENWEPPSLVEAHNVTLISTEPLKPAHRPNRHGAKP